MNRLADIFMPLPSNILVKACELGEIGSFEIKTVGTPGSAFTIQTDRELTPDTRAELAGSIAYYFGPIVATYMVRA